MPKILVVDDEAGLRDFLQEALQRDAHQVDQAQDGQAAQAMLTNSGYDLVVTDLSMPNMTGMELLKWLRATQPDVEVIVLTAHGSIDAAVEAMKLGAFDFVQKPISSPTELRLLVSRTLEHSRLKAFRDDAQRRQRQTDLTLTWGAKAMAPVVSALKKVAPTNAAVFLVGESGTGKEIAARALHMWSKRRNNPFIAINCASLTDQLLESELFGHEKGAFTGADQMRRGRIELAQGGTFFLDEIGELKLDLQAKLLRVIQEKHFERVGGNRTLTADVRWIAATNRDLGKQMKEGSFREDLYHRIAVFPIRLPPLRDRREDIPSLARVLLDEISKDVGNPSFRFSKACLAELASLPWPGNIRELRNMIERAAIIADSDIIEAHHLVADPNIESRAGSLNDDSETLADIERRTIAQTLDRTKGNRKLAAQHLGIGERTLYEKIKRYGLRQRDTAGDDKDPL